MITYILKSGFCLMVSLGFYKHVLEREKVHRFNRVYLLFSLLFSFVAPLMLVELGAEVVPFTEVAPVQYIRQGLAETDLNPGRLASTESPATISLFWIVFGCVTTVLFARFGRKERRCSSLSISTAK